MPKKKYAQKIIEGGWYGIPLMNQQYALGLIARYNKSSSFTLGYFFGPAYDKIPDCSYTKKHQANSAVLIKEVAHVGILYGTWPFICMAENFNYADWPIPKFAYIDETEKPGYGYIREYVADCIIFIKQSRVPIKELEGLPSDGLAGHIALEISLTQALLGNEVVTYYKNLNPEKYNPW